ncbi:STAS domain-containing protein [Billgrantia gudaonensis]|uniref:Phospholipid transport system transporter-binding protein n=1 Tax=Billgrantia gudaonensis TaxID=376427 RepID=A0A1G8XKX5_9GAMM|nr:STAS domain-containing protein [Halomonas gudaonensis]SDJ91103.1 phospholipid transport system transporter-binding protein [Halomonas gudaonensis]
MNRLLQQDGVCLEADAEGLWVSGDVDFGVAAALARAGSAWLAKQPADACVTLDLSGVERVSSAALSVLLEWTRRARAAGITIQRVRLSSALASLTRVAGLATLLPVDDAPR